MTRDLPDGFIPALKNFLDEFIPQLNELDKLLTRNRIWVDRTRDLGVISKADAIAYGLSGPNIRGCGIDHDLRKARPYLDYEKYDFDIPVGSVGDGYDRYLVRIEEMRQSVQILRQVIEKLPSGPINVQDPKNFPPAKPKVLMKMEQLIHHFIIHTEGVDAPPGEVYFGAENPKGELGFYINSRGGRHAASAKDSRPLVRESEHPADDPSRPHDERRGRDPRQLDFVMGECDR